MKAYKPDFIQLEALSTEGHLSKKISECGKYKLFNYTDRCTFEKKWNKHTENSRGTVYEIGTDRVVARAFPKFFNFSELAVSKQRNILKQTNFEVFTKEDGSMITLAYYGGEWRTHTRGSFNSDQAIKAKEMLSKYDISLLDQNISYLLEVIYPENKIVVNYGNKEELFLLAAFDTKTGEEYSLRLFFNSPFLLAESHKFESIQEVIEYTQTLDANNEGFVVRLSTGERFKLKSPEYLKIARIISRMSPLVLWESMVDGKVSQELLQSIPEEFRTDYEGYTTSLEGAYSSVYRNVAIRYNQVMKTLGTQKDELPDNIDSLRKPFALALQNDPNELNSAMWGVLLQKPAQLNKFIMDRIKPVGNVLNENAW